MRYRQPNHCMSVSRMVGAVVLGAYIDESPCDGSKVSMVDAGLKRAEARYRCGLRNVAVLSQFP